MRITHLHEFFAMIYDLALFSVMAVIYFMESLILTFIPRRYRSKNLREEIALVTGAAGGIGRLIAQKLAARGCSVVVWDINKTGVEETARLIEEAGGKCWAYSCDITNREEVYKTAKAVKLDVGNVTILVNNAGYVYGSTLMEIPDEEIERTFKVNVISHYWTTKSFLKEMMRENHGHIVTIASIAGLLGTYNCTDYSATKFAAIGYHESLFTELKTHGYDGINTTLVCPYFINTGMFSGVKPRLLERHAQADARARVRRERSRGGDSDEPDLRSSARDHTICLATQTYSAVENVLGSDVSHNSGTTDDDDAEEPRHGKDQIVDCEIIMPL
ncbi:hypothetical protein TSAR_002940 [Trichomalopsis sarcophagae]|uniref:Short-chain dehydrogenase/reductase 3 n=1 Tax=Trichomalopsis sarcophagae TaxID=543379 RepID=A0A232FNL0_9HYME|nr:hypothetical protein TSAR_002940 [Trichomalopsis sarcophagae]